MHGRRGGGPDSQSGINPTPAPPRRGERSYTERDQNPSPAARGRGRGGGQPSSARTLEHTMTISTRLDLPPFTRLRRMRATPALRRMVRETALTPADFIAPFFVAHGIDVRHPVSS